MQTVERYTNIPYVFLLLEQIKNLLKMNTLVRYLVAISMYFISICLPHQVQENPISRASTLPQDHKKEKVTSETNAAHAFCIITIPYETISQKSLNF